MSDMVQSKTLIQSCKLSPKCNCCDGEQPTAWSLYRRCWLWSGLKWGERDEEAPTDSGWRENFQKFLQPLDWTADKFYRKTSTGLWSGSSANVKRSCCALQDNKSETILQLFLSAARIIPSKFRWLFTMPRSDFQAPGNINNGTWGQIKTPWCLVLWPGDWRW